MKQNITFENLNNMPFVEKLQKMGIFKCFVWITLLCYLFACFMSFYKNIVYINIVTGYIQILAFAVMGYAFCQGLYFKRKIYAVYIIFLIWLILTFWFKDDLMIKIPIDRTVFITKCIMCGIALPFAQLMNDQHKRLHLDAFLGIFVSITSVLLCLSYIGALRGESFSFFDGMFKFGATYTYTDRMMLQFFNLYYYKTAFLAVICFFITLYLAVSHWTKRNRFLFIFLMLTFIIAIIITYSRTAVFTFLLGLLTALYILLQKMNVNRKIRHAILAVCTAVGVIIAAAGLNITYKIVNSTRDIWYGSETLSSRTEIWSSIFDIIKEMPQTLIYGLPINKSIGIINSFVDLSDTISNMHNGYLHTLMLTGIPGFLMILAFCIYLLRAIYRLISAEKQDVTIKLMVIIPVCCLVMNMMESLIFFNPVQTDILNLIFALFSGYIIEYAYHQN